MYAAGFDEKRGFFIIPAIRGEPTKSSEISERLRHDILDGKFDDARKLPSEHQLMRRFAVACETVRAAIRDILDKKLVERESTERKKK